MMKSTTKNIVKKILGSKTIGLICLDHLIKGTNKYNIEITAVLTNNINKLAPADIVILCNPNNIPIFQILTKN